MHAISKVLVVGCGIGGLSCAISCRKNGLEVEIVEKSQIEAVGAGIQLPPNAVKVLKYYGLEEKIKAAGAVQLTARHLRRYSDGEVLCVRPGGDKMIEDFGAAYYVIHRVDYQKVLLDEAKRLGVKVRTGCEVIAVDFERTATLASGEVIEADWIIGADGLWSTIRQKMLDVAPAETGDLVYRGIFSLEQLQALNDERVNELIESGSAQNWMGPTKHCVFYPVRSGKEFNLVLARPDDLPVGVRTVDGDLGEMRRTFHGWDETLTKLLGCIKKVLKWKLCHMKELDVWTRGNVFLLGDACHPSLPYQAQGAAMALEDGAVLGVLLGAGMRGLYEGLRKKRTTLNVEGSISCRTMFHMDDGEEQEKRDEELREVDWVKRCVWQWGDPEYQRNLMGFDAAEDVKRVVERERKLMKLMI